MKRDDESGAGWSDAGASATNEPVTIEPATTRYQELEVAGRGGMGEVVVARDRRLGRRVALKRVADRKATSATDARLIREAWVTARLEHPSIVPVYDTDVGADGELFYTMRLVEGRTLGDAIADAKTRTARLELLRHFLAAVQAVAFAHSHGIVHRDLKPANILVGAFGETQVADWGLAGFIDRDVEGAFASDAPAPAGVDVTQGAGTPGYMSPEQARGVFDRRSDVWSLGAILHEIVTGTKLRDGGRIDGAPELRAIVEHATALEPGARYRDATELAADVMRYLDGHRVAAHDYSTLELAQRLARRLRVPLLLAGTALVVGAVVLAGAVRRITAERERAVVAEAATARALTDSQRTSAGSLAAQAVTAVADGAMAETELLATHALALGESADARGALAAARAATPPLAADSFALGPCQRVVPATWTTALCHGTSDLAAWELGPSPRRRWQRPLAARLLTVTSGGQLAVTEGADTLHAVDLDSGAELFSVSLAVTTGFTRMLVATPRGNLVATSEGRTINVVALDDKRVLFSATATCGTVEVGALAGYADQLIAVCKDGAIRRIDARSSTVSPVRDVPQMARIVPATAAASSDGRWLVVGGVQGDVMRIDLETGESITAHQRLEGLVHDLAFVTAPERVLVAGDNGPARVWDFAAGSELVRLPRALGVDPHLTSDGILTGGVRAARWRLPPHLRPRALEVAAGIAAIAVDPRGRYLAIARGDGVLEIRDRASGTTVHSATLGTAVIKSVDFSGDGERLAVSISESHTPPSIVSVTDWSRALLPTPRPRSARRVLFDASGRLLALHYAPPLSVWNGTTLETIETSELVDGAIDPLRREVVMIAIDGAVLAWRNGRVDALGSLPGATLIATAPRSGRIAGGHDTGVSIRERDGTVRWIPSPEARLTALAVSPDERFLLGGRSDGTIAIWEPSGALRAVLRGHRHRIATLAFAPDGLLYSAGWDGRLLAWDLAALDATGDALVPRATAAWASDLELVLGER